MSSCMVSLQSHLQLTLLGVQVSLLKQTNEMVSGSLYIILKEDTITWTVKEEHEGSL